MDRKNDISQIHYESDKFLVPFLLICPELQFLGTEKRGTTVYFKFTPYDKTQEAINSYFNRTAPLVHAKDLFDSTERFRNEIYKTLKLPIEEG